MNMVSKKYRVYFNNINKNVQYESINIYTEEEEGDDLYSDNDIINMAIRKCGKTKDWLDMNGWLFIHAELKEVTTTPIEKFVSFYNRVNMGA